MKQLTVEKLYELVKKEMKKGNGKKYIITADDIEGNSFHGMWFGFLSDVNGVKETLEYSNGLTDCATEDINEIVILG